MAIQENIKNVLASLFCLYCILRVRII